MGVLIMQKKILLPVWNYEDVKDYAQKLNLPITSFINICVGRWIYFNDTYNNNDNNNNINNNDTYND